MNLRALWSTTSLLKNLKINENVIGVPRRGMKALVEIDWVRPVRPPCNASGPDASGDLVRLTPPSPLTPAPYYKDTPLLKEANDQVKTIFSIGHQGSQAISKTIIEEYINRVKRHQYDITSPEVKVAVLTAKIRYFQDYLDKFPRDVLPKHMCKELIDKRKKYLRILRQTDYKLYEWTLEKLDIVYKPHPVDRSEQNTRKKSLVRLLDIQCKAMKDKKMKSYKEALLLKKEKLLQEFAQNPI